MKKDMGAFPIRTVLVALALVAWVPLMAAAPAEAQQTAQASRGDLVLKGDAKCTRCHDEEDDPKLITIGRTKHGTRADGRTPTCTTCHGESDAHVNVPKGTAKRPKPDIYFSKNTTTPAAERSATCLTCHKGRERMFWDVSTHASRDISCNNCHRVHNGGHDKVRERKTQAQVCFTCHKTQRIQVTKVSHHPILEGKVVCSDCHNPHGSAGPFMLARDTVNDTCYKCHAEKRGPFIWNHEPVTENCAICHNPHGTNIANLLRYRSPFLCQECHEPGGSHRGGVPGFGVDTGSTAGNNILFARGCVNCHTNIHGSNNPQNSSRARAFFR